MQWLANPPLPPSMLTFHDTTRCMHALHAWMHNQVLFFFVSILKALSYALNEPCKEMLYIPTSDTIRSVPFPLPLSLPLSPPSHRNLHHTTPHHTTPTTTLHHTNHQLPLPLLKKTQRSFKAKAWIDVFGVRTAKAVGSVVTNVAKDNPDALVKIGSVPSWIVSVVLLLTSVYMGRTFEKLQVRP
jgi:hypothetical protein